MPSFHTPLARRTLAALLLSLFPACAQTLQQSQPRPAPPSPTRAPSTSTPPQRLPDPPPPPPTATPPRTEPPSPPPAPRAAPPARDPIRFYVQFTERGDRPRSKGLRRTLRFPNDVNLHPDETRIVYEWRPEDGRERQANPRTAQPWGPILKPSLPEQMLPDNLDRHLRTMDAWLDAWVPRDFDGIVCFDLERWSIRDDSLHRQHRDQDHRDRLTPDKTLPDLMADFVRATEARARALRPRVREWGWWGLAGINPGFPVWKPDEYERSKTTELAWAHWLSTVQTPMPVYYFNASIRPDDRPRAWAELTASHQRLFGRERLARDGIAYLSAQGPPTPDGGWRLLTPDEFRESFVAARDAGLRRFIVWAAIDSPQTRDGLQRFIDDTLAPLAREVGAE